MTTREEVLAEGLKAPECPVCCPQPQSRSDDTACSECAAEILKYRTVLAERGIEMMPMETQIFVINVHVLEEVGFPRHDAIIMVLNLIE